MYARRKQSATWPASCMGSAWLVAGGGLVCLLPATAEAAYLKGDGGRVHRAGPVTVATATGKGTWRHLRSDGQSRAEEYRKGKAVRHSGCSECRHMGAIRAPKELTFGEHDGG
jgi:hypothetical protein